MRDRKLRALAVTSLKRSPALPSVPTVSESGLQGFDVTLWYGLLAPSATPPAIVGRLHVETVRVLALDEVRTKLADLGIEIIGGSPGQLTLTIKSEIPKWAKVIRDSGIRAE
jgi:tripartite-type tricarboxylate transporter receptor subunit TctC